MSPVVAVHHHTGTWLLFDNPVEVVTTTAIGEVSGCLRRIEECIADGFHAAGFIGYEAGEAFDGALKMYPPDEIPLLWFGIFREPVQQDRLPVPEENPEQPDWYPSISYDDYLAAVHRIRSEIAAGSTYQVNYTFRLTSRFSTDPWEYFRSVAGRHPAPYAAYVDAGRYKICSFSPELFFMTSGNRITLQPMKGTARRGAGAQEDREIGKHLQETAKERAENIMIVDMIRNDIGKIARNGSVRVTELCAVRQYRTLMQMVSTVEGEVDEPLSEQFRALFPCASVTGAPKIQTCAIIRELENTPRHLYCGSVGWSGPGRESCFNVAIRTVLVDTATHQAEYGTGSGIVWDSRPEAEFGECLLKTAVINPASVNDQKLAHLYRYLSKNSSSESECSDDPLLLVETMLWTAEEGFFLLDEHLQRLKKTAAVFSIPFTEEEILHKLRLTTERLTGNRYRIRLTIIVSGSMDCEVTELPDEMAAEPLVIGFAEAPVESSDPYLYVKTSRRRQYTAARERYCTGDDLLFFNEAAELTEMSIGNLVVEMDDGKRYTPPVTCGLLPGVFREHLLANGEISERRLRREDLRFSKTIFRINSVRGWQQCRIIPDETV
jgi:para-aminobenzoate synthetase / 4-amino-4-deoxychorismate lyase